MWLPTPANQDLFDALLSNNLSLAQQALCAGAAAATIIRQRSLLESAIRLRSAPFVDLLLRHGATAGDRELRAFCEQVKVSPTLDQQAARATRAIGSLLHRCGADLQAYVNDLMQAQPTWFEGLWTNAQKTATVSPGHRRPRLR